MKRSALVVASLLLGAVACDGGSGDRKNADNTPSTEAKPPVSATEARRILEDLDKKDDSDSLSPAYWRRIHEGRWLDRTLANIDNINRRGKDDPSKLPSNRPDVDPLVHTWVAEQSSASPGDWILGAQQVSSYTVGGESKNTVSMRWSLYHRSDDGGPWRIAYSADAPAKKDLPQVALNKTGAAPTVDPDADLAVQPAKACGVFSDYITQKNTAKGLQWSTKIDKDRATHGDTESLRKQLGDAKSVHVREDFQRTPVGPAWQTQDGAALVACVGVNTVATDMGPGRWLTFTTSGWDGTTGIRWNNFTQSMMQMTVLKVPTDGSEISIAAQSIWPYKFDGTKYNGT